ncbi:Zn-ribbon domain-containing OB-fold protein [Achromobacter sp. NPDC058515]|uniref:Zn-ribbon domain-containing OB-fold protein n=1 Tax=Achromobacter sp. NPDC058515 TaxID=3346533 RepID=UPI0036595152
MSPSSSIDDASITPEAFYRLSLGQGCFRLQRCTVSGNFLFYPRRISPWTGRPTLRWEPVSGRGVVYSTTVVRRRAEQGGDYNVALIDLEEGPRMMSRVENIAPGDVSIGMPVIARIAEVSQRLNVVFDPVEASHG